jgi:hypothetical protein
MKEMMDWTTFAETTVRPGDEATQPYRFVLRVREINGLDGLPQYEYSHHMRLERDGSLHWGHYDTSITGAVRAFKLRAKQHNVRLKS